MPFAPDYQNLLLAAQNQSSPRLPLYEHIISPTIMESITGKPFASLLEGNYEDKKEYFRHYCAFFQDMGYDTVSFEQCIGEIMPGSGTLGQTRRAGHPQPAV